MSGGALTVPNVLSVGRLLCAPLFLWLLLGRDDPVAAAWLLAGLGSTDWVDGWVARRFDQVSELGKVLDPTADRILLVTAMAAILAVGAVPLVVAVPALAREVLVAGGALVVAARGGRRIDVQWAGKAGTFGLMVAFPLFLVSTGDIAWAAPARTAAWVAAAGGLVFGWVAAVRYVPMARAALAEAGAGHGAG